MTSIKVAYVLLRFPSLTETFIAEEIRNIKAQGVDVALYSLLPPHKELVHPVSAQLLSQVRYVPGFFHPGLAWAQIFWLVKSPGKYFRLMATILGQPAPHKSFLLKRLLIFFKSAWLAYELVKSPVDLLHTHFAWLSSISGIVVSRYLGIPFSVTAHAYDIYSTQNDLLRLAASSAERMVTISEANKSWILKLVPNVAPEKIEVIHCGIDLAFFRRQDGYSPGKTLQITSVGSLIAKKGHEYLIRACSELKSRQVDFDCVIVGTGELMHALEKLIRELGLDGRVVLAGAKSQEWVRDRLNLSDIFVLACATGNAGDQDGIPVAIMEAMAMEVPVISTPVSGIPEIIRDGKTGLMVPEKDEKKLAEAIMSLVNDGALRQTLTRNGLSLVQSQYDITKNAKRLAELFETISHMN